MFGYKKLKKDVENIAYGMREQQEIIEGVRMQIHQLEEALKKNPHQKVNNLAEKLEDNLNRLNTMVNEYKGAVAMERALFKQQTGVKIREASKPKKKTAAKAKK